jgi:hypothetical protein
MEKKFRQMAYLQSTYGNTVSRHKLAKQLRICAYLCKRMQEEPYPENAKFYGYPGKAWAKEWSAVEKQDREMLGKMIAKHVTSWWD